MSSQLTLTKAQLEDLDYPRIAIQLKDGYKFLGRSKKFTIHYIYIETADGILVDIPRRLIQRIFLLLEGDLNK